MGNDSRNLCEEKYYANSIIPANCYLSKVVPHLVVYCLDAALITNRHFLGSESGDSLYSEHENSFICFIVNKFGG
jgi:hypothetical protein